MNMEISKNIRITVEGAEVEYKLIPRRISGVLILNTEEGWKEHDKIAAKLNEHFKELERKFFYGLL